MVTDKEVDERVARVLTQFFGGSRRSTRRRWRSRVSPTRRYATTSRHAHLGEDLREGGRLGEGHGRRGQGLLQRPSRALHAAAVAPGAPHPRQSKALADDIHGQLSDGGDFAALAKKHSIDSSKDVGGTLTIRMGETVPQFEKAALALKVNEISKPVKTRFGWHVIQALGPLTPRVHPLASVRQTIRDTLAARSARRGHEVARDLKQEYADKIEYASGFAPPATSPAAARPRPVEPRAGARRAPGAHRAAAA